MLITVKASSVKRLKSFKDVAKVLAREPQAELYIGQPPLEIKLHIRVDTRAVRLDLPRGMERLTKHIECAVHAEMWRISVTPLPEEAMQALIESLSPEARVLAAVDTDQAFELIHPYAHAMGFDLGTINRWANQLSVACWEWLAEEAANNPAIDPLITAAILQPEKIDDLVREVKCSFPS